MLLWHGAILSTLNRHMQLRLRGTSDNLQAEGCLQICPHAAHSSNHGGNVFEFGFEYVQATEASGPKWV